MLRRIRKLFQRYAMRKLTLTGQVAGWDQPGRVDHVTLSDGRLKLAGTVPSDQLWLEMDGVRWSATPGQAGRGFEIDAPFHPGHSVLCLRADGLSHRFAITGLGRSRVALMRMALVPGFLWACIRAVPWAIAWLRKGDASARAEVKRLLGLSAVFEMQPLDASLFPLLAQADMPAGPATATIILPVYNAFDMLAEVLDRVEAHSGPGWYLVAIEDGSSDPRVRPWLRDRIARMGNRAELIEHGENQGFIAAVNTGFKHALGHAPDAPVVLLNTDAFPPQGWLSRLIRPITDQPDTVASVTPMSNDAELMSVPVICAPVALQPGEADALDRLARRFPLGAAEVEAPTGVGFCMALNPRFLRRVPGFDTAFGRGYAEEVDWCRKTLRMGGRHICLPGLFVEHRGAGSFGNEEKQRLLRRNGAEISRRYPEFDEEVQRFLRQDPLRTSRLALGLKWADLRALDAGRALPVYLGHSLGGGAEHYLADRIALDLEQVGAAVVLRVGGRFRWQIELHTPLGITGGVSNDTARIRDLMEIVSQRDVTYSCGVGDPDPIELPKLLCDWGQGGRLRVLMHDYFPLSPSYTLLGQNRVYSGLPDPKDADPAHGYIRPDGSPVDLKTWQDCWAQVMAAADEIVVFSQDSQRLVSAAYPDAAGAIRLEPHALRHDVPACAAGKGARPVIGVLGNVGQQKGADILVDLSRSLGRTGLAELVLVGDLDPAYTLSSPARVHGSYQLHDICGLVERYGITCWLVPSIWPETFSYVTHEVLATGLPVWCFDIGAQGDAVRAAVAKGAPGGTIELAPGGDHAAAVLAALVPGGSKG